MHRSLCSARRLQVCCSIPRAICSNAFVARHFVSVIRTKSTTATMPSATQRCRNRFSFQNFFYSHQNSISSSSSFAFLVSDSRLVVFQLRRLYAWQLFRSSFVLFPFLLLLLLLSLAHISLSLSFPSFPSPLSFVNRPALISSSGPLCVNGSTTSTPIRRVASFSSPILCPSSPICCARSSLVPNGVSCSV